MAVEGKRLPPQDGAWIMRHGSWVEVDGGAVVVHLVRSGEKEEQRQYNEDLDEASELLAGWGLDPGRLACKGLDEDGDLFELLP